MKISFKEGFLFFIAAVLCFAIWARLSYPQYSFVDLRINKKQAMAKAAEYLKTQGIDAKAYSKAAVFDIDAWGDRYLQKTVGLEGEEAFTKTYHYELFYWKVRFFKQFQKEEFFFAISPGTGEVLSYSHYIDDIASRDTGEKDAARQEAAGFLKEFFKADLEDYDFHEEKAKRFEGRTDYSFSWAKKNVYIPWKKDQGGAKLLIGATVSGQEVREFYKDFLDVPEKFKRHIENQLIFGEYLFNFYLLLYFFLLICAVNILIKRRQNVVMRLCKRWFLSLAVFLAAVNALSAYNNIHNVMMNYPTSASLASFIGTYSLRALINIIFLCFVFVIPGMAGESLRMEAFPEEPYSSFGHYLRTSFCSRGVSRAILFGYILFFITLGLQSGVFYLGQRYLGVWKEWVRLTKFSSATLPFLSAFAVSITASLNEEVTFRLFGISLGKKYLKNTALAIFFASLIWGMGHSAYAIFPVWFRTIEVGLIGIIYGWIFVKVGLIPLIVSHYLLDVFFGVAGHILGRTSGFLFMGSAFILSIPLLLALVFYFINKKEEAQDTEKIKAKLSAIQQYNLDVLMAFVSSKKSQGYSKAALKAELLTHDWDVDIVEAALDRTFGDGNA